MDLPRSLEIKVNRDADIEKLVASLEAKGLVSASNKDPSNNARTIDGCGFVCPLYEAIFNIREHRVCPVSGTRKRPLVGGYLYTSTTVISICTTAGVLYREFVRGSVMGGSLLINETVSSSSIKIFSLWSLLPPTLRINLSCPKQSIRGLK